MTEKNRWQQQAMVRKDSRDLKPR